ncbi:protein pigeon [Diorhabda carinulata]|uniref:protein pigeon n=1 Tax=Diorhabda carinulata TaxID=1163345 RepID=UPI0025A18DCD|nr:protein pigeon [Diorhabda carinulata]
MVSVDNLASKLVTIISAEDNTEKFNEWRLLGQERNESFLFSWVQTDCESNARTGIGEYNYEENTFTPLYLFKRKVDCVQASLNNTKTIVIFVIKEKNENNDELIYKCFLHKIGEPLESTLEIDEGSKKQTFVQFLDFKVSTQPLKFLLLIHQEGIFQYHIKCPHEKIDKLSLASELLVKNFFWAQWDPNQQTLYYIHNKVRTRGLVAGEEMSHDTGAKLSPTLSGLQFHDDQPHESVLNIPLNLPHLSSVNSSGTYEDDIIPLRIHDSSLDLIVLTDSKGCVCICHHYLYQPVQPIVELKDNDDDTTPVNVAYTVTALHQSCVIHCIINDIPWNLAKQIRPLFKLRGDTLVVFIPKICTHILDVGLNHDPICHITTDPLIQDKEPNLLYLAPMISADDYVINLANLDVIDVGILDTLLINTFKSETSSENKLAIIHYLLLHLGDTETVSELILWHSSYPFTMVYPEILKEFLLATSYTSVQKNIPENAVKLATLLPITTVKLGFDLEFKHNGFTINLRQEVFWNASMMVLSPQLRIIPYKSDIWTKLWDHLAKLSKAGIRFKPSQVLDKLRISLDCYQPEALSRCSTPLTPSTGTSSSFADFLSCSRNQTDFLPFHEIDSCTASRQEYIISVNLRELSMHLLKQTSHGTTVFQTSDQSAMHVHAVATRYVGAQLEQSRQLCQIICKAATYDPTEDIDKGFILINNLNEERRYVLFKLLEKYYMAVESLAFPLPQGFTSFFAYLGYRTMDFEMFEQYVTNRVFELQVDVMKIIFAENNDSKEDTAKKLKLLTLVPRQRAKRLLNQWNNPIGVVLRAREHAQNILSGVTGQPTRSRTQNTTNVTGLGSISSGNNMSPLDTFLDLLTAKASLADIDFSLLIEATETILEEQIPDF